MLVRGGLKLKSINWPVISRPDHFIPVSLGRSAVGAIRGKRFQVVATVLVPEESNQFCVGEQRDGFRPVNCIQVGNERDRNPIVSRDTVVPAQDYAGFAGGTRTQDHGRLSTNVAQIHSHVATSGESAILTIPSFPKYRPSASRAPTPPQPKHQ